jgi:hypothetical protein
MENKKRILEKELKDEAVFLEKSKREKERRIIDLTKNYETSLAFDKHKD